MGKRNTGETPGEKRNSVNLGLRASTDQAVNQFVGRTGQSKAEFLERLLEWFRSAPDSVKFLVAGVAPEDLHNEYVGRAAEHFASMIRPSPVDDRAANAKEPKSEFPFIPQGFKADAPSGKPGAKKGKTA